MATWVVGDIHGCYRSFEALLEQLNLQSSDRVVCVGDLINRGPDSAAVLDRFMTDPQLSTVLGNHDCAYLMWALGEPDKPDTLFEELGAHPHHVKWVEFLRHSPLMMEFPDGIVVHAGVWPWASLEEQRLWAQELSLWMQQASSDEWQKLRAHYRTHQTHGEPFFEARDMPGEQRLSSLFDVLTKIRYVDVEEQLSDFRHKGYPLMEQPGLCAWFDVVEHEILGDRRPIIFGHWSALEGLFQRPGFIGLDTGCVWGGRLTAYCLETREFRFQHALEAAPVATSSHTLPGSAAQLGFGD